MDHFGVKLAVLSAFLLVFALAIRKNRVFVVPFILLFYSNINGLLDWEDFALKGLIKFQDYGLILAMGLLVQHIMSRSFREPDYVKVARGTALYNVINAFWFYYIGLFLLSVFLQGPLWPVKMGRTFFYGLFVYVAYREIMLDPLLKFGQLLRFMMWATLFFACLYILYNLTNLPIYPKGDHEVFVTSYLEANNVKRNFSGFPTFTHFFLFYFVDRLLRGEGSRPFNLVAVTMLSTCVVMMLTRYTLAITVACVLFLVFYRRHSLRMLARLVAASAALALLLPLIAVFADTYVSTLTSRFDELATHGLLGSSNVRVRIEEFQLVLSNVMDFDPLFGFGFTVPMGFGYRSNVWHAGSADNGFTNILGVTGFVGLVAFAALFVAWITVNRRLRALNAESLSRVTFTFILFVLAGMMNNAHAGYFHYYGVFMVYDLFAYAYLKHKAGTKPSGAAQPALT